MDLTIADQLAEFEDPPSGHRQHFAATDLIRTLLIHHISATEPTTHLHLFRQVLSRCTQAFEVIHQLISASNQPGTPLNWNIFDAYTQGIPILESILLSFETAADSCTQQKHLPDQDDLLGALRFIFLWDQERTQLVEASKGLASDEFLGLWQGIESNVDTNTKRLLHNTRTLLQSAPFSAIARDDLTTLRALWDFFDPFSSERALYDAVPKDIARDVLDTIWDISLGLRSQSLDQDSKDNIQQAFSSPHYVFAQFFTRSLMLMTIPFSLLSKNRPNLKPLDDSTKEHLVQEKIWNEMRKLARMLLAAVDNESERNNVTAIENEYACLRNLLLSNLPTSSDPLVDETLKLLRLSANVFRRFQQRSIALIRLLHSLDHDSSTKKTPFGTRNEVRKVFLETITLLEVTEERFRGRSLRSSATDEEYDERATAFENVFVRLRQCGKLLDPPNSWLSKEADFLAAVELDETHMKDNELFHLG